MIGCGARSRSGYWGGLAVALVSAAFLRLWQIEQQVPIDDEWHAIVLLAEAGYSRIASTFGVVDHSIPLTLLYKAIADQGLLSEASLLALPVVCGLLTWLGLVTLAGRTMRVGERVAFAALLSVSPLLILYAREARPYALTLALTLCALGASIAWWNCRRPFYAVTYVVAATLASYAHLIVVPAVFSPWLALLWEGLRTRRPPADLLRAARPGAIAALLVGILIAPPLFTDWQGLRVKAGADFVTFESATRAAGMLLGTGHSPLAALLAALSVLGAFVSLKRHPLPTRVILLVLVVQSAAVVLSGALWTSWPMVLARYLLLFVPLLAYGIALGLGEVCRRFLAPGEAATAAVGGFLAAALYMSGPLPPLMSQPNAFFSHHAYWADFDPAKSRVLREIATGPLPDFYKDLGRSRRSGEVTLIETPWRFESMFNRHPIFLKEHRQRVRIGAIGGVCAPGSYAEHPRRFPSQFRNLVDLAAPDEAIRARGDYLVLHRRLDLPNMTEPWQKYDGAGLPSTDACLTVFTQRFGKPSYEDDTISVFDLRAGPQ